MRFRFRGTRGSIPVSGVHTVKYGGNTTCIEIRSDAGELIVLDAGTGILSLGLELAAEAPVACHVFITHAHWDHIQGLPFFLPLFVAGNRVTICGPPDPLSLDGVETMLAKQMEYPHFPVRVAELAAEVRYRTLSDGQSVDLGFARVSTILMNHPAMDFGFKVECDGKSLFFTGDHEPIYNIYAPDEPEYDGYERIVLKRRARIMNFLRGVDVLIADAPYTKDEYAQRKGWGHSSMERTLAAGRDGQVGMVYLTHHDITRTDAGLDDILARLRREWDGSGVRFDMAREGPYVEI